MLGYTPPQPRFWKALLVTAPFVAVVAWSLQFFHIPIPPRIVIVGAIAAWLVMAATVHARVSNDWRTQYQVDRLEQDERTKVAPNTRISRE